MSRDRTDANAREGATGALRSFLVPSGGKRSINPATHFGMPAVLDPDPFATVFRRIFRRLAPLRESFQRDGLLAVAVWQNERVTDYLHVPVATTPEFITLGRHSRCDVLLSADPTVSLRHAVAMADPTGDDLRVRLLDLRSGSGFETEEGLPCESLSADGALFVRLGGFHLFFLPTGAWAPLPWGATAEEAWSSFPERIYYDCRAPQRPTAAPRKARDGSKDSKRPSIVTSILEPPGPLRPPRPRVGPDDDLLGTIELHAGAGVERHPVHRSDAERGLLIGRYERCELGVADDTLSRVHVLVVRRGQSVWAVDTASSNGSTVGDKPIRHVELVPGIDVVLAQSVVLRWLPSRW